MSSWQERLKVAIGPQGYSPCMRRSLQTVILYEARRCLESKLQETTLKPFQRKAAHIELAFALLESLTFIQPYHKEEILWRTHSSKETIPADIAWKRAARIENDMSNLAKMVTPLIEAGKTHGEVVDMLIQRLYENVTGFVGKKYPSNWEHAHNHTVLAFRLYYQYDRVDSSFPEPIAPREIHIPSSRDEVRVPQTILQGKDTNSSSPFAIANNMAPSLFYPAYMRPLQAPVAAQPQVPAVAKNTTKPPASAVKQKPSTSIESAASIVKTKDEAVDDRLKVLQEVREHLDLLKEFEGVVSAEELASRKRALFLSLPSAPTITEVKKSKS